MKHPALWLVIGIIVGLSIPLCINGLPYRYSVISSTRGPIIKIDRSTGKSWVMGQDQWEAIKD